MSYSHSLLLKGQWGTSPGLKRPGGEVNLLLPSSAQVENECKYASNSSISVHNVVREVIVIDSFSHEKHVS